MKRVLAAVGAAALLNMALAAAACAQSVVITNARILDGAGHAIENGSIVARDGRIVSVTTGPAPAGAARGARRIDARGRTALPAYIDDHRHLIQGDPKAWLEQTAPGEMKAFLDAGFTTVFSMGDDPQAMLEVRSRVASGQLPGPRLMAARIVPLAQGFPQPAVPPPPSQWRDPGRNDPARPPRPVKALPAIPDAAARAAVDEAKAQGFDAIKTILVETPGGPEAHTLAVIVDEAHKQGLRVFTHATNYLDSLTAVNARVDVLAHTPHIGQLEENPPALQAIADAHIPVVSTLQVFIPHFEEGKDEPLYRDGGPFPMPRPLSSAGQGPVNARLLWDKGVVYAYGTDTQWDPRETLRDELRGLSLVFSPRDILKIMGPNSAAVAGRSADLGALEPGKLADIVLVDGDPLDDIYSLTRVALVVKEGRVVVDKTGARPRR